MDTPEPDQLRLRGRPQLLLSPGCKAPRHWPGDKFLKGPVPMNWLNAAARLPGKALHMGIAVWHLSGLNRSARTVTLTTTVLREMGIRRTTGYRALAALEQAGLVSVVRQPGRAPVVTLREAAEP